MTRPELSGRSVQVSFDGELPDVEHAVSSVT